MIPTTTATLPLVGLAGCGESVYGADLCQMGSQAVHPTATAARSRSCRAGEALATTARPKPSPDPIAGRPASDPPSAAVTTPPASLTMSDDAATS